MNTTPKRERRLAIPLAGSWTAVPNDMLRDTTLSVNERMLLVLLRVHAGLDVKAFPRQAELARLMNCDQRSVQRWVRTLHSRGYVVKSQTIWGNLYTLVEPTRTPNDILTGPTLVSPPPTPESDAHPILGSPPPTPESDGTYYDSDSLNLDSSSSEGAVAPPYDDDDPGSAIREAGDPRTGKLLRSLGIGAWRTLQREFAHVPHEAIARRVQHLADQGKEPGIIVHSLRSLPFDGATMDERGPQPLISPEFRDRFKRGDDMTGLDGQAAELTAELAAELDRSDPDLAEFFKECDL